MSYDLADYRDYTRSPQDLAHSLPERNCNVEFELRPILNQQKTDEAGRSVYDDIEFVIIRPSGTNKLTVEKRWSRMSQMEKKKYENAYNAWKSGDDIPVTGTHLKMWPLITPAQLKHLNGLNIFTVEQLADADANAMERIGMGAVKMKEQAQKWLEAAENQGRVVTELQGLKDQMAAMQKRLEESEAEKAGLLEALKEQKSPRGKRKKQAPAASMTPAGVGTGDPLDD